MPAPIRTAQALTGVSPATVTGPSNAQGASESFAHADHQHRLEVSAADDGAAIGNRPIINFTGAGVVVTDDAGNDRINVAIAGGAAASWAAVLGIGQLSGGTNPTLTAGDEFQGDDSAVANAGAMVVRAGDYLGANQFDGGPITVRGGDSSSAFGTSVGGDAIFRAGDSGANGPGGDLECRSGSGGLASLAVFSAGSVSSGQTAGRCELHGGDNLTSGGAGFVLIRGGNAPAVGGSQNASGGNLNLQGGAQRQGIAGGPVVAGGLFLRSGQRDGAAGATLAGLTGSIVMTTNAVDQIGDMPSTSLSQSNTGSISINTEGVGPQGRISGGIRIATGSVGDSTGNVVGDVVIETGSLPIANQDFEGAGNLEVTLGTSGGGIDSPGGGVAIVCGAQTGATNQTGSPGGGFSVVCGDSAKSAVTSSGGEFSAVAGSCSGTDGRGGGIVLTAGDNTAAAATARGGDVDVTAGSVTGANSSSRGGTIALASGDNAGNGDGGDATVTAGDNTNAANNGGRGGDVLVTAGDTQGNEDGGRGGDVIITAGFGGPMGKVDILTQSLTARITRRTGGSISSGREFLTNDNPGGAPAGGASILYTSPQLTFADGDLVQIVFRGSAVDQASDSNVIAQIIEQTFYRAAGVLTPLAANRNDKQGNGAGWGTAGSYSLVVAANSVRVHLNSSGIAYTVNQRFSFEFHKLN